jgi:ABC-type siderophore export system fused ATPase/permease subunit
VIAFYRLLESQARVAIFDEAMANCDTQTRDHFYKVVSRRDGEFADKTIITILHDPEYLEHFGRVIYFGALPVSLSPMSGGTLLARADEVIERSGQLFEPGLIDNSGEVSFGVNTSRSA